MQVHICTYISVCVSVWMHFVDMYILYVSICMDMCQIFPSPFCFSHLLVPPHTTGVMISFCYTALLRALLYCACVCFSFVILHCALTSNLYDLALYVSITVHYPVAVYSQDFTNFNACKARRWKITFRRWCWHRCDISVMVLFYSFVGNISLIFGKSVNHIVPNVPLF